MMPRAAVPAIIPLFAWQDLLAIEQMERERAALIARMAVLPPNSHRRVVLAARLQDLTHRQLAARVDLRRSSS
ncbi:MAG: hypothetical protein DI527_16285 [Chelatococcus sp.]|nr:MAG: hypothetical protein DI527_16285 [Chelatococcus sp.]